MSQAVTVPPPASAAQALGMLQSAMGYLAAADATAMAAQTQARCLRVLEQVSSAGTAARTSILAAFTSGQGYSARRGLQPAGLADPPDPRDQGRRRRVHRVGPAGRRAPADRAGAGRGAGLGVGRAGHLRLDRQAAAGLPAGRGRDPARRGGRRGGCGGPGRAGRGDLRPLPPPRPGQGQAGSVRRAVGEAGDHVRGCRGADRGPHPGVRVAGEHSPRRSVGAGRGGGHPEPAAALP